MLTIPIRIDVDHPSSTSFKAKVLDGIIPETPWRVLRVILACKAQLMPQSRLNLSDLFG